MEGTTTISQQILSLRQTLFWAIVGKIWKTDHYKTKQMTKTHVKTKPGIASRQGKGSIFGVFFCELGVVGRRKVVKRGVLSRWSSNPTHCTFLSRSQPEHYGHRLDMQDQN